MAQPDYNLLDSFRKEHSVLAIARQSLISEVNLVLEEIEITKNIIREAKKLEYPDPLDRVWQMNSLYQTLDKLNARRVKLENAIRHVRSSIKYTNTNMNFVRERPLRQRQGRRRRGQGPEDRVPGDLRSAEAQVRPLGDLRPLHAVRRDARL